MPFIVEDAPALGQYQGAQLMPVFSIHLAPTNGITLAGIAVKGALLVDTVNASLYINTGSRASPTWQQITIP